MATSLVPTLTFEDTLILSLLDLWGHTDIGADPDFCGHIELSSSLDLWGHVDLGFDLDLCNHIDLGSDLGFVGCDFGFNLDIDSDLGVVGVAEDESDLSCMSYSLGDVPITLTLSLTLTVTLVL